MRKNYTPAPVARVMNQIILPLLVLIFSLFMSGTEPLGSFLQMPYEQLNTPLTEIALWFSASGHFPWVALVAMTALIFLLSSKDLSTRTKTSMALFTLFINAVLAGGGAWFNENIVKEHFRHPRPDIEYLSGPAGNGPLGMTAMEFYQGRAGQARTKLQRSDVLRQALKQNYADLSLSAGVREHWINETGYSFPSGHSFAAMFFASYFLALGLTYLCGWRKYMFYLLLPWAVAVCYSRLVLRVHTPLDITVGGLEGLILGIGGFLLFRALMKNYANG